MGAGRRRNSILPIVLDGLCVASQLYLLCLSRATQQLRLLAWYFARSYSCALDLTESVLMG